MKAETLQILTCGFDSLKKDSWAHLEKKLNVSVELRSLLDLMTIFETGHAAFSEEACTMLKALTGT